jgi:tetratricopeptide (TPR) repeat protein
MKSPYYKAALMFALVLLVMAGCTGNDPLSYRYEAERLFAMADRLAEDARIKPELNTDDAIDNIRDAYGEVVVYCRSVLPEVDSSENRTEFTELSSLLYYSTLRHAQLFFGAGRFDTCVALFSDLLNNRYLTAYQRMFATVNLGQSLQASGRWELALAAYNEAVETYYPPVTPEGDQIVYKLFNIPNHVYRIYARVNDTSSARESFLRAESYYREIIGGFDGRPLAMAARTNLASLYDMARRYDDAIIQLSQLRDTTGIIPAAVQMQIAEVEATRKGDFGAALSRYEQLEKTLSGADTALIPLILFRKAMALLELDQYSDSREMLAGLEAQYPGFFASNPTAQLVKAKSFELQDNWDRAITEYRYLIENYGRSDDALNSFLHLDRHFREAGRQAEASRWFEMGLEHCDRILARSAGAAGRNDRARALIYKADLYRQRERWSDAAGVLDVLCTEFTDTRIGQRALLVASELHRERLSQPDVADSLLSLYKARATHMDNES